MDSWIRSTRCGTDYACVEVAISPDDVKVRDSNNPDTILTFTTDEWRVFCEGARLGEFDL